jgi:hypothetical protein
MRRLVAVDVGGTVGAVRALVRDLDPVPSADAGGVGCGANTATRSRWQGRQDRRPDRGRISIGFAQAVRG